MFSAPATLVGMAGVVLMVGGFTSVSFSLASLTQAQTFADEPLFPSAANTRKAARLAAPVPASHQESVSIVELVGLSQATVILRGNHGEVLYRSDPRMGTTLLSKNTDLPVVTLKEATRSPVVQQHPAPSSQEGTELQQDQKPKRRTPVGCMADVSSLVKAAGERTPSLCLVQLERSLI